MANHPQTVGLGGANAPGQDARKTESTTVAEVEDSFDRDLHGEDRAGQHAGAHEARTYSAYDIKELHASMPEYSDEELKQIPILAHGERLEQGAVYLDLNDRAKGPFRGHGGAEAQDPHLYVSKSHTDYVLWNKLTGVDHGGTPAVESREA
jgi:hypothetical protein